jgi:hypothetical protein
MEIEYFNGTTKRKMQLLLCILIAIGGYILINSVWLSDLYNIDTSSLTIAEQKEHLDNILNSGIYISSLLLPIYIYAAIYCFKFGRRISSSQQYPPPGAEMPFATKIVRGKKALFQAYGFYVISIILVLKSFAVLGFSIYNASAIREMVNAI